MDRLALTPGRGLKEPSPVVDSSNIIGYLGHNQYFNDPRLKFAPELDLKWCSRFIKQVDRAKAVEDYVEPESLRVSAASLQEKRKQRESQSYLPTTSLLFDALRYLSHFDPIDPFKREAVERYKLVYWDFLKNGSRSSRVKYGKYDSVGGSLATIAKVADAGNTPLIDIHSHPDLSLFSPNDYINTITLHPLMPHKSSLVRAQIVVCPTEQILALATPATPLMERSDAIKWAKTTSLEIDDASESVNGKTLDTLRKWIARYANKISMLNREQAKFEERLDKLGLSQDKFAAYYITNHIRTEAFLADNLVTYLGIAKVYSQLLKEGENWVLNRMLQQVYRDLSLKMYRSTDMRHFKEFDPEFSN